MTSSFLAGALMSTFLAPPSRCAGGLGGVGEDARGLDDDVDAQVAPRQVGRVALAEDLDLLAVDDQRVLGVLDGAVEGAVGGVVLEEQGVQLDRHEVVDGDDLRVGVRSMRALSDWRPMRPKPLMPTRVVMDGTPCFALRSASVAGERAVHLVVCQVDRITRVTMSGS